jgi:hypothetical protein
LQRISLVVWADTAVGTIQSLDYRTFFDHTGPTDSYKVFYSFQATDGRDYHREAAVDRSTFETLTVGDAVTVNYLPFFPRYALLDYQLSSEMADYALLLLTAVIACYLFIVEAGIFGATIYRIQDERF